MLGRKNRAEDDEQIQLRHRAPDLDEALKGQVGLAPEKSLNRTSHHAQQHTRWQ